MSPSIQAAFIHHSLTHPSIKARLHPLYPHSLIPFHPSLPRSSNTTSHSINAPLFPPLSSAYPSTLAFVLTSMPSFLLVHSSHILQTMSPSTQEPQPIFDAHTYFPSIFVAIHSASSLFGLFNPPISLSLHAFSSLPPPLFPLSVPPSFSLSLSLFVHLYLFHPSNLPISPSIHALFFPLPRAIPSPLFLSISICPSLSISSF